MSADAAPWELLAEDAIRSSDARVLAEVIRVLRDGVAAGQAGRADLRLCQHLLCRALISRFKAQGRADDLAEAVALGRAAVAAPARGSAATTATCLSSLAGALFLGQVRSHGDLSEAIGLSRKAVELAAGPDESCLTLGRLAGFLLDRYRYAGDADDLAESVRAARRAVAASRVGHWTRPDGLGTLGAALRASFERTGDMAELDEAISMHRRALADVPPESADHAACLDILSCALITRVQVSRDVAAIAEGIEASRRAVAMTAAGHFSLPSYLSNLGVLLHLKYLCTGADNALAESVEVARRAVAASRPGDPDSGVPLQNLACALQATFGKTRHPGYLVAAEDAARQGPGGR